jgi:hypothetical protein
MELIAISSPSFRLFDELRQEIAASPELGALRDATAARRGAYGTVCSCTTTVSSYP